MTKLRLTAVALCVALAGCDGTTEPGPDPVDGIRFTDDAGATYEATGVPTFVDGELDAGEFAIAVADSVGGVVITSFRPTDGTRGDLFILQLVEMAAGEFGPCGTGGDCHGRLLEGIDAENVADVTAAWEIIDGDARLDEAGPDRVAGTFADVVLSGPDDAESARNLEGGEFDVPLLTGDEAQAAMRCFLTRATGGSCD